MQGHILYDSFDSSYLIFIAVLCYQIINTYLYYIYGVSTIFFCKACAGKEQLYSCNILSSALGEAIVHCPLELLLQCELPPLYLVQVNFAYIGTFIKCFIVQITSKATKQL